MASSPARASSDQAPVALPADLPTHLTATLIDDLAAGRMASMSSLAAALAAVPDARHRRGRRHELAGGVGVAPCAGLTGARAYVAVGEWGAAQGAAGPGCLADGPERTAVPCETTVRRCLQATDAPALDAAVAGWAGGRLAAQQAIAAGAGHRPVAPVNAGRRVIAIDGKTLRGSAPRTTAEQVAVARRGGGRTHLVAAYDHASGVTLGQLGCAPEAGKGGEVATAMALSATLDERRLLAGSVITVDAGFTARELAADLRARGAHWILRVKGNQKTLHARLTALPWAQVPEAARVRSVGHGRVETRTIRVIDLAGSDDGHGEFFPTPPRRSRSSAVGAPGAGAGARRPSTPSPAWMLVRPIRRCWPAGCAGAGASRAACTGCATWSSPRTTARFAPAPVRSTSPSYAPWRSTPYA